MAADLLAWTATLCLTGHRRAESQPLRLRLLHAARHASSAPAGARCSSCRPTGPGPARSRRRQADERYQPPADDPPDRLPEPVEQRVSVQHQDHTAASNPSPPPHQRSRKIEAKASHYSEKKARLSPTLNGSCRITSTPSVSAATDTSRQEMYSTDPPGGTLSRSYAGDGLGPAHSSSS